jgi:hypothetical protein
MQHDLYISTQGINILYSTQENEHVIGRKKAIIAINKYRVKLIKTQNDGFNFPYLFVKIDPASAYLRLEIRDGSGSVWDVEDYFQAKEKLKFLEDL